MRALKNPTPTTASFVFMLLIMAVATSNSALATIAPKTKPVDGENSPFPTDTPARNPVSKNTPAAMDFTQIPSTSLPAGTEGASTVVAQPAATVMASVNPAVNAKRPALPVFWLALTGLLSVAGLMIAARLVFGTEPRAAVAGS